MSVHHVIQEPVVTEKSTAQAEQGKYAFRVQDSASKARIKEAVEQQFGVAVVQVNVMTVHGKMKRFGNRLKARPSWKKAIVTLKPGDKIELFASR